MAVLSLTVAVVAGAAALGARYSTPPGSLVPPTAAGGAPAMFAGGVGVAPGGVASAAAVVRNDGGPARFLSARLITVPGVTPPRLVRVARELRYDFGTLRGWPGQDGFASTVPVGRLTVIGSGMLVLRYGVRTGLRHTYYGAAGLVVTYAQHGHRYTVDAWGGTVVFTCTTTLSCMARSGASRWAADRVMAYGVAHWGG